MKSSTYEDMRIGQDINVIGQKYFPVSYHLHWHKYAEVILMTGAGDERQKPVISINHSEYPMEAGDVVIVWPGELHEISGNEGKNLMAFQFPVTLFTEIPDFAIYVNLFRTYHHISMTEMPQIAESLAMYVRHVVEINAQNSSFPTVERLIGIYEMFMQLATYIRDKVGPETDHTLIKIDRACRFIQENCEQNVTLNGVAEYINFSPCYFSRLFKQTTQYSFVDYLNLQRVKRAQTYLADPGLNMTEISYQSGFKSISTFNRVFRQFRGCSPTDYRRYYVEEGKHA